MASNVSDFFQVAKARFEKCLEPTMSCPEKAIRAHSIQNAKVFELIAEENHLYEMRARVKNGEMRCGFEKIGRNEASTFTGFCAAHDTSMFSPIDTKPFSIDDTEQLFLIAYRAVTRELHAVLEGAVRLQTALNQQILKRQLKRDEPSPAMLAATAHIVKAWNVWKYRAKYFDTALQTKRWDRILHSTCRIEGRTPLLASSSFFSIEEPDKALKAIALNIIPTSEKQTVIAASYPREHSGDARKYVAPIFLKEADARLFELSYILVDRAENFFLRPSHVDAWTEEKRRVVQDEFISSLTRGRTAQRRQEIMLF